MQFNQTQLFNARQGNLSRDVSPAEMTKVNGITGMDKRQPLREPVTGNLNMYWTGSKQAHGKAVVMSEEQEQGQSIEAIAQPSSTVQPQHLLNLPRRLFSEEHLSSDSQSSVGSHLPNCNVRRVIRLQTEVEEDEYVQWHPTIPQAFNLSSRSRRESRHSAREDESEGSDRQLNVSGSAQSRLDKFREVQRQSYFGNNVSPVKTKAPTRAVAFSFSPARESRLNRTAVRSTSRSGSRSSIKKESHKFNLSRLRQLAQPKKRLPSVRNSQNKTNEDIKLEPIGKNATIFLMCGHTKKIEGEEQRNRINSHLSRKRLPALIIRV